MDVVCVHYNLVDSLDTPMDFHVQGVKCKKMKVIIPAISRWQCPKCGRIIQIVKD